MIDRFLKWLKRALILAGFVIVGFVALMTQVSPESTNVTSNLDGQVPLTTRRLDPSVIPTTTVKPHTLTSGPSIPTTTVARHVDEFVIVYAGRAVTVHRSLLTEQVFRVLERMAPG